MVYGVYIAIIMSNLVVLGFVWVSIKTLISRINELDSSLAMALSSVSEILPNFDGEGQDPIKMAIAGWIASMAEAKKNTFEAQIIPRNDDGTFSA
jgi:hypothetical protein